MLQPWSRNFTISGNPAPHQCHSSAKMLCGQGFTEPKRAGHQPWSGFLRTSDRPARTRIGPDIDLAVCRLCRRLDHPAAIRRRVWIEGRQNVLQQVGGEHSSPSFRLLLPRLCRSMDPGKELVKRIAYCRISLPVGEPSRLHCLLLVENRDFQVQVAIVNYIEREHPDPHFIQTSCQIPDRLWR